MQTPIAAAAPARPAARQPLVIRDRDALDALSAELASNLHRRHAGFVVEVGDMDAAERQHWRDRLERGYFACGCATATAAGLAALAGFLIHRIASAGGIGSLRWADAGVAVLVFAIGTGLGKALGRRRARLRLLHAIDQLRARVPAGADRPVPWPPARCGLGSNRHEHGGRP